MKKKMVKGVAVVALAAVCLVQFTGMASQARSQGLADLGAADKIGVYTAENGVLSPQAAFTPTLLVLILINTPYVALATAGGGSDSDKENRSSVNMDFRLSQLDI